MNIMMNKTLKRTIKLGLMPLLATLVVAGISTIGQAKQPSIPEVVRPCIPSQVLSPIIRTELIAQASAKGKTYYLLYTYSADKAGGTDLVISVAGTQCKEEFYNAPGDAVSLTKIVERDIANQLAVGRYQNEIRQFGRAKVQTNINRAVASNGTFHPEDIWALKKLGFKIPANAQVTQ